MVPGDHLPRRGVRASVWSEESGLHRPPRLEGVRRSVSYWMPSGIVIAVLCFLGLFGVLSTVLSIPATVSILLRRPGRVRRPPAVARRAGRGVRRPGRTGDLSDGQRPLDGHPTTRAHRGPLGWTAAARWPLRHEGAGSYTDCARRRFTSDRHEERSARISVRCAPHDRCTVRCAPNRRARVRGGRAGQGRAGQSRAEQGRAVSGGSGRPVGPTVSRLGGAGGRRVCRRRLRGDRRRSCWRPRAGRGSASAAEPPLTEPRARPRVLACDARRACSSAGR